MTVRVLQGDCRDVLRTLPDESVHCVVTSPPYFGLRDYGTAKWEGGDTACDHKGTILRTAPPGTDKQASNFGANAVMAGDCKCGDRRIDSQIGLELTPDAFTITIRPYLPGRCPLAGPREGDSGAHSAQVVFANTSRPLLGIELNPDYAAMARRRISGDAPLFAEAAE